MRSQVIPRFDSPLFPLTPAADPAPRQWINVSNQLEVMYRGRESLAYLDVSASMFHVMRVLGVPTDSTVTLFLEEDGPRMLFGAVVDDERLLDLWHYTMDRVPAILLS